MDEVIWLELLSRHHEVVSRRRVSEASITLGRAYDNDVVLDDPYVAAHHLRLARSDDGAWIAEDLGSVNGVHVAGVRARQARVAVDGGTTLRIGHTFVRLRHARDAVAPELPLARGAPHWLVAALCLAAAFALALLDLWLGETAEPKLIRYLTPLIGLACAVAIWTAAWSVLSRVFAGHARFGLHFAIAGAGLLAFSVYDELTALGAFALSWTALAQTAYVGGWLIFAAIVFAHLRALGRARLPLKALAAIALAALGITMQSLRLSEWRSNYGMPTTLQRLEPPALRLVGPRSADAFFADAEALKARLDRARSEEPPDGDDADAQGGDD
ncbi:MAG TPA: FHA domain-containing protein [Dokdonella sp.]